MSSPPRRHSYSEGMKHKPHEQLARPSSNVIKVRKTQKQLAIANNMLRGYAQGSYVRETMRMIVAHNRKLKAERRARQKVDWADRYPGTEMHRPLPRRHGPSVIFMG